MEYFVISAKFFPLKYYRAYTLIATAASNLVLSWVFGSANSVTRPDRCNVKMVYSKLLFLIWLWHDLLLNMWAFIPAMTCQILVI